jgi:hypothetical protein
MDERSRMAFELVKKMMELDWRFDTSSETWDEAATKRAVNIVDQLMSQLKGETENESQH